MFKLRKIWNLKKNNLLFYFYLSHDSLSVCSFKQKLTIYLLFINYCKEQRKKKPSFSFPSFFSSKWHNAFQALKTFNQLVFNISYEL